MSLAVLDQHVGHTIATTRVSCEPTNDTTERQNGNYPQSPQGKDRSKIRLVVIMLGLFLALLNAALDQIIIATAIPTISVQLNSASGYTWIGGAYLLANAGSSPVWAKLSDIWGRKPLLLSAVAMFFVSSVISASAKNITMLLVSRSIQGCAGGGLIVLVNIVISDLFSMRSRSLYLGLLECVWALATGAGPIIGGAFAGRLSWRWIWWINLPISGITFVLLLISLDVHNPRTTISEGFQAIDWLGSLSIVGLTLMLLLGLNFGGQRYDWGSPQVICLLSVGCFVIVVFILCEKYLAKYPLIPPDIFRRRSNIASLSVCFLHGLVFVSGEYYLPLYFQSVKQASPLHSGILILALGLPDAIMAMISGIIINLTGRYSELIWTGAIFMTVGYGLFIHLSAESSITEILCLEVIAGVGSGMLFEPPLIAVQAVVSQDDVASATATLGFVRCLAMSASILLGGVVFQNGMKKRQNDLLAAGLPYNITQRLANAAAAEIDIIATIRDPHQQFAAKEAYAWALRNIWIMSTCLGACAIIAGGFVSKQMLSRQHTETRTGLKKGVDREKCSTPASLGMTSETFSIVATEISVSRTTPDIEEKVLSTG